MHMHTFSPFWTALATAAPAPPASPAFPPFPPSDLRLMTWVGGDQNDPDKYTKYGGMNTVVQQLQDNPGLYTGAFLFCGWGYHSNGSIYMHNATRHAVCSGADGTPRSGDLIGEARRQKMELIQVMAWPEDLRALYAHPQPYIDSFVTMAKAEGWSGMQLDAEWRPWHNLTIALATYNLFNTLADGLHAHGLRFTAAVQSVTDAWGFKPDAQLDVLLASTRAKLCVMDSYYGGVGRVLDSIDFYAQRVPTGLLGIGMSSRERTPTVDGFVARFHALRQAGIREVDMFVMPINETWLPWLRKWKNQCRGCPSGGVLSCFEQIGCY